MTNEEALNIVEQLHCMTILQSDFRAALYMAMEALEKQIPTKPENGKYESFCPFCGLDIVFGTSNYCTECGQALDWSEV